MSKIKSKLNRCLARLFKESATLANRLIEGQVSNAQYAEESYQLKRENSNLRKQLDGYVRQSENVVLPSVSNDVELADLRESIDRLTTVGDDLNVFLPAEF